MEAKQAKKNDLSYEISEKSLRKQNLQNSNYATSQALTLSSNAEKLELTKLSTAQSAISKSEASYKNALETEVQLYYSLQEIIGNIRSQVHANREILGDAQEQNDDF